MQLSQQLGKLKEDSAGAGVATAWLLCYTIDVSNQIRDKVHEL
jgi:hypothetical protein